MKSANVVQKDVIEYLTQQNIKHKSFYIQNIIAAYDVNEEVITSLSLRKDIKLIYANAIITQELPKPLSEPTVEKSVQPEWNLDWINATALWRLGFTGKGSVVGGADTGIQWDHPALKSNYRGFENNQANHNFNWFDGVTTQEFPQCRSS
jgi:serine protease AprX